MIEQKNSIEHKMEFAWKRAVELEAGTQVQAFQLQSKQKVFATHTLQTVSRSGNNVWRKRKHVACLNRTASVASTVQGQCVELFKTERHIWLMLSEDEPGWYPLPLWSLWLGDSFKQSRVQTSAFYFTLEEDISSHRALKTSCFLTATYKYFVLYGFRKKMTMCQESIFFNLVRQCKINKWFMYLFIAYFNMSNLCGRGPIFNPISLT